VASILLSITWSTQGRHSHCGVLLSSKQRQILDFGPAAVLTLPAAQAWVVDGPLVPLLLQILQPAQPGHSGHEQVALLAPYADLSQQGGGIGGGGSERSHCAGGSSSGGTTSCHGEDDGRKRRLHDK
jgi:hypothetical protein